MVAPGRGSREIDRLFLLLQEELRSFARAQLARRGGITVQTTALLHEAYVRLASRGAEPSGEEHFRALAARVMRQVLVDYARRRGAAKRGEGRRPVTLSDQLGVTDERAIDVLALHEALERLARFGPRQAGVVELRFFGGLPMDEVASTLGVSKRLVEKDWSAARAWLRRELAGDGSVP